MEAKNSFSASFPKKLRQAVGIVSPSQAPETVGFHNAGRGQASPPPAARSEIRATRERNTCFACVIFRAARGVKYPAAPDVKSDKNEKQPRRRAGGSAPAALLSFRSVTTRLPPPQEWGRWTRKRPDGGGREERPRGSRTGAGCRAEKYYFRPVKAKI